MRQGCGPSNSEKKKKTKKGEPEKRIGTLVICHIGVYCAFNKYYYWKAYTISLLSCKLTCTE